MTYKIPFVITLLSFFVLKAHGFKEGCSLNDHKNGPSVTFVWKNKCNTHSTTYVCSGGFKPDATFLKGWKNISQKHVVYEFSQTVAEELPYYFRTDTIEPILEKSCNSGCFGIADPSLLNNDNFTCMKPNEQAITFYIRQVFGLWWQRKEKIRKAIDCTNKVLAHRKPRLDAGAFLIERLQSTP